jgi:hypothetical protein
VGSRVGGVRSGTLAAGEMAAARALPWPLARAEVRPGLARPAQLISGPGGAGRGPKREKEIFFQFSEMLLYVFSCMIFN